MFPLRSEVQNVAYWGEMSFYVVFVQKQFPVLAQELPVFPPGSLLYALEPNEVLGTILCYSKLF